jgi:gluconolactonase
VDDYAEVWVNGRLPAALGQVGGPCIKGFNAPNRVVLTRDARPGQTFQLAVLAMNGPVSDPPANFLWVRSATLDFHRAGTVGAIAEFPVTVTGRSAGLDAVLPPEARIERVATGFTFTEGPVWHPDGYLLFSDPNENVIYRWSPDGQVTVWRAKSGYAGVDLGEYRQSGSNGLALDPEGRLAICQHGNRRVIRLERTGAVTVLADRHEGKRLNSPNDLVFRSDGALFFTDPCFGLPGLEQDPRRELPVAGVFSLRDGTLRLVASELKGPNGIALSPDERRLYVGNWDERAKVVRRYDVAPDATLSKGEVFCDLTGAAGEDAIDGIKVDRTGNVYVSGPGGLWVLSPSGERLGTIVFPEHPHNLAWGDADGRTLYVAAQRSIYRVRLRVSGARVGAGER